MSYIYAHPDRYIHATQSSEKQWCPRILLSVTTIFKNLWKLFEFPSGFCAKNVLEFLTKIGLAWKTKSCLRPCWWIWLCILQLGNIFITSLAVKNGIRRTKSDCLINVGFIKVECIQMTPFLLGFLYVYQLNCETHTPFWISNLWTDLEWKRYLYASEYSVQS